MDAIIQTSGISKTYGQVHALNNVSLEIQKGATGLLGPNGAGKSTLIRSLIGLVVPDSGTGTILGRDITTQGLEARQFIGYMPEHECLLQDMEAVKMVAYAGQLSGMPKGDAMQRAHEVLHFVGIGDERYREIETFSTGMKQKVNLAQALVHDPEVLFLDEPTNGLDPKGRLEMLELIRFLAQKQGKSIVLSSHILADVEYVCEHIVVLAAGEVLLQGRLQDQIRGREGVVNVRVAGDKAAFSRELLNMGYQTEDQESYMMKVIAPGGARETAAVHHPVGPPQKGGTIPLESGPPAEDDIMFQDIMKAAAASGIQIRYSSKSAMNLEDLFIELVEQKGQEGSR